MKPNAARWTLAVLLSLLAVVAVVFFHRQNAGEQVGGGISLAKTLWLAFAIGAWFILPPVLMSDGRLDVSVRCIFRWFWLAMMARGAIELVLLYLVVHWNPWYGIGHDLFCLGLVLWLRRGAGLQTCTNSAQDSDRSGDLSHVVNNRRALRFSGTIAVSLVAEICFAAMFMQTGAHQREIYFVSADPSWNYVNFVTWIVVAYVYADGIWALVGLYFPGLRREMPRLLRAARITTATFVVLVVCLALTHWTHMMRVEAQAEQFKQVGFEIIDACYEFQAAFVAGDEEGMANFARPCTIRWQEAPHEQQHDIDIRNWTPDGDARDFTVAVQQWRSCRPDVEQAAFKIHLLDEVVDRREAVVQLRFEVTSNSATDTGVFRCRFVKGDDQRWRVTQAALVEGQTVAGGGDAFVDRAEQAGAAFVVLPDLRFEPGQTCDRHHCTHPGKLRFQMMRFAYASCATSDFDGDGHDDVFFCCGQESALLRNRGDGTFEDATKAAGLGELWHINTAGFADLDNDGDQDLLAFAFYGRNYVFANNGDGTFRDVSEPSGLIDVDVIACYCLLDYDNDGDLDLYLGRPLDAREHIPDSFLYTRNGQPNILYRNDGDFRFTDVTDQAGAGDVGLTLSLAAADYDGDGDQDIYLANDFGRNVLLQNQGDGAFRDVAQETGSLAIGGSMSASWGDYNNDGRLDLYVAAIRSNQRWFVQPITARRVVMKFFREGRFLTTNPLFRDLHDRLGDDWLQIGNHALAGNSLLQQQPDGTFVDVAEASHTRPAGWYWSSGFFDLDNDGDLDIYAANGWITGEDPHDL